jgi:pimeloyl-ACP methyl ester carboxylesterase
MSGVEELFLDIQGVRTRLLRGGHGPALVYWHGAGGAGAWAPHHALLAERFTVYAPDHPGWGGSDNPEWMDTIQDYVLHYDGVFRALDLSRPVLVGHSLGGWMAAEFAATYPDRLDALVLVDAAGMPFTHESVPDFFAVVARGGRALAEMIFHKPEVAAAYFPASQTPEEQLRAYRALTSTARIAWDRWFEDKLPRRLARVTTPTLVLWGAHERLFPVEMAHKFVEALPDATLQVFDDCGHMAPFENPTTFAQAIAQFCASRIRQEAGPHVAESRAVPGEAS